MLVITIVFVMRSDVCKNGLRKMFLKATQHHWHFLFQSKFLSKLGRMSTANQSFFHYMYNPPYTLLWDERVLSVRGKMVLATGVSIPAKSQSVQRFFSFIHLHDLISHDFVSLREEKFLFWVVGTIQAGLCLVP